jgi:lathosterol oxidase
MRRGFKALFYVILLTTLIIWKVQPTSPYYGYYETHDFGIKEFLISLVIYMVTFDVWFYTSHVIGHMPFFWKHFHGEHHEFVECGAYA